MRSQDAPSGLEANPRATTAVPNRGPSVSSRTHGAAGRPLLGPRPGEWSFCALTQLLGRSRRLHCASLIPWKVDRVTDASDRGTLLTNKRSTADTRSHTEGAQVHCPGE